MRQNTTPPTTNRPDPARLWHDNPIFRNCGWSLEGFLSEPDLVTSIVLFPTDRTPDGYLPLLPKQVAVAARCLGDQQHHEALAAAGRCEHISPTGRRPVTLRNGLLVEPLAHCADKHPRGRPWPRTLARLRSTGALSG